MILSFKHILSKCLKIKTVFVFLLFLSFLSSSFAQTEEIKGKSPIIITLSAERDSVCPGEGDSIYANISGGDGGPYSLYNHMGQLVNNPYILYALDTQGYVFTAKDSSGNQNSASISIYLFQIPSLNFYTDLNQGCAPLTVHFMDASPYHNDKYIWDFGDSTTPGDTTQLNTLSHIYLNAGEYDIKVTKISEHGCMVVIMYPYFIYAYPKPIADFTVSPSILSVNDTIRFTNNSTDTNNIWTFGDGYDSHSVNSEHFYTEEGLYNITLVSFNEYGCSDKAEVTKYVYPSNTFLYSVYPNPVGSELTIETITDLQVEIYDLKGRLVNSFVTTKTHNVFDLSNLLHGFYILKIKDDNHEDEIKLFKK